MKYRYYYPRILLVIFTIVYGCGESFDNSMCGEPKGTQKMFMESVNLKFKNILIIKHVPCYGDYMKIELKNTYNKNLIDSIEKAYDESVSSAEFLVYDKNGKLIRGSIGSM